MQKILIKNRKIELINVLKKIFNKKVLKFTYLGRCKLNRIMEYNFLLYEFNVMLDNYSNYTVFIKKISGEDIKETLFCYWQFCEENYNMNGKFYLNKANLRNQVFKEVPEYVQKYTLQLLSKNNKIWKASDINIVDLRKMDAQMNYNIHTDYFDEYKRDIVDYKNNTKEYLFIGII